MERGKKGGHVEACSGHSCLPNTLCHSAQCVLGNQPVDLLAGPPVRPHWPCLASLWLRSRPPPYPLSPATHTHTHSALTAAPIKQHRVLFLPPQNPGCPSRQESKASLKPERVNGGGEEERTAQAEPHLAASCSALCQIETEASCTLYRHTHTHIGVVL